MELTRRCEHPTTLTELSNSLRFVFGECVVLALDREQANAHWVDCGSQNNIRRFVTWHADSQSVVAFLFAPDSPKSPCAGIALKPGRKPGKTAIGFAQRFGKVFNYDIAQVPTFEQNSDVWLSLRQTQFRRAIARSTTLSTIPMVEWMQAVESSTSLRYEGEPFSLCLIMVNNPKALKEQKGAGFVPFQKPMTFQEAILGEKWIRATVDGTRVVSVKSYPPPNRRPEIEYWPPI